LPDIALSSDDIVAITAEVGEGYVTDSIAVYVEEGDHVLAGQQIGEILIGSYATLTWNRSDWEPVISLHIGEELRGGISEYPVAISTAPKSIGNSFSQ
jgi:hypothetical protein